MLKLKSKPNKLNKDLTFALLTKDAYRVQQKGFSAATNQVSSIVPKQDNKYSSPEKKSIEVETV